MPQSAIPGVYPLRNSIQEYAWGSRTAIPELLGRHSPADKPQAELWMGAHPKAPSRVVLPDGEELSLTELIARDPEGVLGPSAARKFDNTLPFLFKVLAAARPLSIQAHPTREQARAGFRRENEQGIPLDAFQRNYRDDNHKPEVISALTPFWALNGFRTVPEMLDLLESVGFSSLATPVAALSRRPTAAGLKTFFASLMRSDQATRHQAVREALAWSENQAGDAWRGERPAGGRAAVAHWLKQLAELYPGDIGVLSPLLLNLVLLHPGDTMYLDAGVLHAYLEGTGIELMANSDNVIRGGLTSKHLDVEELLSILRFRGEAGKPLAPGETAAGQRLFRTPAREFQLADIRVAADRPFLKPGGGSIEIIIIVEGRGRIETTDSMNLGRGDSLLIPASTASYTVHGSLHLYRASVP